MKTMFSDGEFKLMELLWEEEPVPAKDLSIAAAREFGWNKNTTYTVIKKLIEKGAVRREEPMFICRAAIKREDAVRAETETFIKKLYNGSKKALFSALLDGDAMSGEELCALREMLEEKLK